MSCLWVPACALGLLSLQACGPDDPPDPDPVVSSNPSGVLMVERIVYADGLGGSGGADTADHTEAYFRASPDVPTFNLVSAGEVSYNNNLLEVDTTNADSLAWLYEGNNYPDLYPVNVPSIWTVTGSTSIPAFTYTHAGTRPDIIVPLPDTLHTATGWTISFPAFMTGADSVNIQLVGNGMLEKGAPVSAGSITFSPAELQSLQSSGAVMQISGYSLANEVISGKRFWFVKHLIVFCYAEVAN